MKRFSMGSVSLFIYNELKVSLTERKDYYFIARSCHEVVNDMLCFLIDEPTGTNKPYMESFHEARELYPNLIEHFSILSLDAYSIQQYYRLIDYDEVCVCVDLLNEFMRWFLINVSVEKREELEKDIEGITTLDIEHLPYPKK